MIPAAQALVTHSPKSRLLSQRTVILPFLENNGRIVIVSIK
jgi:hypothetical protein